MNIEEMKKKLLIDSEKYDETKLEQQITLLSKFCKVDAKGRVLFTVKGISNKDKIKLVLVARFLANKLDNKINPRVNVSEIAYMLSISEDQARARLSDIAKEGFATPKDRGVYLVVPYRIDDFLGFSEVFIPSHQGEL